MYIIAQDSRKDLGKTLALVDRRIIKDKWWTTVLKDAIKFKTKQEAQKVCDKYKHNNPRVIGYDEAKDVILPIVVTYSKKYKNNQPKHIFHMNNWEYKEWLGYSDAIEQGGGSFE